MRPSVETQIRRYFDQVEESHGSLSVTEVLDHSDHHVVAQFHEQGTLARPSVKWAWAAGLILFIGLTLFFASVGRNDSEPVEVQTTVTLPPTVPPEGALDTGTLQTSIGPAQWWAVSGAENALPGSGGWLFETSTGFEMVVGPGPEPARYWTSADGVTWREEPLPSGLAGLEGRGGISLRHVGDEPWLATDNGGFFREGDEWRGIPFPTELGSPGLDRIDGDIWLTSSEPLGIWRLDGDDWMSFDPAVSPTDLDETTLSLGATTVGAGRTVVVSWDADTITVIDPDGTTSSVVPPWAEQVAAAEGSNRDDLTMYSNGERFVAIVVDWMPGTECTTARPDCATPPDTFELSTWTSEDGVTWEGPEQPGILPNDEDAFGISVTFNTINGYLFAGVEDSRGSSDLWFSSNGLNWEQTSRPFIGSLSFDPVEGGWIDFWDSGSMYTSPDLRTWEPASVPPAAQTGAGGGSIMWASSGSVFYVYEVSESGTPTLWIADFGDD